MSMPALNQCPCCGSPIIGDSRCYNRECPSVQETVPPPSSRRVRRHTPQSGQFEAHRSDAVSLQDLAGLVTGVALSGPRR